MIKELRHWKLPTHVEIRSICKQGCIFFTYWQYHVAKFCKVELAVTVDVESSKEKEYVIMSKVMEVKYIFKASNYVLYRNVARSSRIEYFKAVKKVEVWLECCLNFCRF